MSEQYLRVPLGLVEKTIKVFSESVRGIEVSELQRRLNCGEVVVMSYEDFPGNVEYNCVGYRIIDGRVQLNIRIKYDPNQRC
ncbi:hypothetical protein GF386_05860 [Candidatus Pacearchaeota archaeon]|nr:hypothetical protein [Candidatus Pacearchaeota archaeon]MBD3283619.1 hypothetical protein [Candidatus Pacearchaeota archaeon]